VIRIGVRNLEYSESKQFDELLDVLRDLPESEGVSHLLCPISGFPVFFPGGRGYAGPSFPHAPVMLLGHNYGTDEEAAAGVERGFEDFSKVPTWRNLLGSLLPAAKEVAGPMIEHCFFTNFYLGAIVHPQPKAGERRKKTNTGPFRCSEKYPEYCAKALVKQVAIVRPEVIALLGAYVPPLFATAFPDFGCHCGNGIGATQAQQPDGGHILKLLDRQVQVISLYHPSYPRGPDFHRKQGRLLGLAVKQARQRTNNDVARR
jgi:hypothetical protein